MAKNTLPGGWLRWPEDHTGNHISIHQLIQKFHIDIGRIAEMIVMGELPISAITSREKSKSWYEMTDADDLMDRVMEIQYELKLLLTSGKDFQDTPTIDLEILDVLEFCWFDRKQFADAYLKVDALPGDHPAEKQNDPITIEKTIRKTRVGVESEDTLKIRLPGSPFKSFTCDSLGMRIKSKAWRTLADILSNDPPVFRAGASTDKKRYDSRQGMMKEINKKLIDFFNTQFRLGIPKDFKFFELAKDEGQGAYRLKMRACVDKTDEEKFEGMPDDEIMKMIGSISNKLAVRYDSELFDQFTDLVRVALNRGVITPEDANRMYIDVKDMDRNND